MSGRELCAFALGLGVAFMVTDALDGKWLYVAIRATGLAIVWFVMRSPEKPNRESVH
jgi:hypothetical protein